MVLDARGLVTGWGRMAEELFGYPAAAALGRNAAGLVAAEPAASSLFAVDGPVRAGEAVRSATVRLRHRDGRVLAMTTTLIALDQRAEGAVWVVVVAESEELRRSRTHQAMLRGLFTQSPVALLVYDTDLRMVWSNAAVEHLMGLPLARFAGTGPEDPVITGEIISPRYPPTVREVLSGVLRTGESVVDMHFRARVPADPSHDRIWACTYFRLQDMGGHILGVCGEAVDITDRYRAQQRLALLVRAGRRIGTTLDVHRTADEIADVVVPDFADAVSVALAEAVPTGGELAPVQDATAVTLRRVAWRTAAGRWPESVAETDLVDAAGQAADSAVARSLAGAGPVQEVESGTAAGTGVHARLTVPLCVRDCMAGVVVFLRAGNPDPFDSEEVALAQELAARAAVCFDNARRYIREHTAALTLRRSLLPKHLSASSAVQVAHRYRSADAARGVSGDWFDVIPLSGARVALVVGGVLGHGLGAAATMGRIRTTVRALAQLDLPPDELLDRLDSLVGRPRGIPDRSAGADEQVDGDEAVGATCLYAVYDPIARSCAVARAGHPGLVAVGAGGGAVAAPDLPVAHSLGTEGAPFETTEFDLPVGSLLALFTDGRAEAGGGDAALGRDRLVSLLAGAWASLEELGDRAVAALGSGGANDDATLLLARTRALDDGDVALWSIDPDPALVGDLRGRVSEQLAVWGLTELAFVTELVVSELVTNAIRYAPGPVRLRLIRDRALVCEVSDTGHTSAHLRHAASDDEGGRGLFMVAQMTQRWGTRYTEAGKTIWTEQSFDSAW